MRGWLIGALGLVAFGVGGAAAQTAGALTLPPLGTPGTGTGSGTGGAGNSRLGGSIGGIPGMGNITGPTSSGVLMPGGGVNDYQGATGAGRGSTRDLSR